MNRFAFFKFIYFVIYIYVYIYKGKFNRYVKILSRKRNSTIIYLKNKSKKET